VNDDLDRAVQAFEAAVLAQRRIPAAAYDEAYYRGSWRADGNRYDLETRREVEGRHPALIRDVFAPGRVLDVGCGPGALMTLLAELGVEADGIDASPAARALAPAGVQDRITTAEATELPVPDREYELVICRELLEHLTAIEIRRVVSELCRVSARFVYVTARFHPAPGGILDMAAQLDVDPTHITLLAKDLVRCLFVLEGFQSRPNLEKQLDWGEKGRVLVYELAPLGQHA
jgi:SAM-dependent methyltransferase